MYTVQEGHANDEGAVVRLGNTKFGKGDEYDGSSKFYCGRHLGESAIPGSDGQCGPSGGGQCASCVRFQRSLCNDEGAPVKTSPQRGYCTVFYCGRRLGVSAIPGSDGRCGPTNGPQCMACQRFQRDPAKAATAAAGGSLQGEQSVEFTDREGDCSKLIVRDGRLEWHANGRLEMAHVKALELSIRDNLETISVPGNARLVARLASPPPGPPRVKMLQTLVQLSRAASVQLRGFESHGASSAPPAPPVQADRAGAMRNDEGAVVRLGNTKFGKGDEYDGSSKFYCGRHLGESAIPGSDGQCGPSGGGQCASCVRFQRSLCNDEGAPVKTSPQRGYCTVFYCGRRLGVSAIPGSDGRCGPTNGPQCMACQRFQRDPAKAATAQLTHGASPADLASPADPETKLRDAAKGALARALEGSSGVPFPHVRLMVRGVGGSGKSSTIDAMAGKEFDAHHRSTVGAAVEELQLTRRELSLGGTGGALRPYKRLDGLEDSALALANHAASLLDGGPPAKAQPSMLESLTAPMQRPPSARPPSSARRPAHQHVAAASEAVPAKDAAKPQPPPQPPPPKPAADVPMPAVPPELVIKCAEGGRHRDLVLRVQDTGGQPIFLSILELLTTPAGTVYMVVFSLAKLQQSFEDTLTTLASQVKSIQAFAQGAPVLLCGTRKAEVAGGAKGLMKLSDRLYPELAARCGAGLAGIEWDKSTGLCFFGVENSKGFAGDETLRELVKAIEAAA